MYGCALYILHIELYGGISSDTKGGAFGPLRLLSTLDIC